MPKNERALPDGFMTVGKLAERMGVTVRTLQYYDREGLLSPTAESGGGRRLYTDKDMIQLHQILSLKSLVFSLADVADALAAQAAAVREKIAVLTESLTAIETLRAEVLQMQTVDFKKYADIIVNLQMKNEFYWLIKHFDERTLDHIRSRFDKESGRAMLETFNRLQDETLRLQAAGEPPEGARGQALAAAFWQMVTEFTGGDMEILAKLMEMGSFDGADAAWRQRQAAASAYIEPALDAYFTRIGTGPTGEDMQ